MPGLLGNGGEWLQSILMLVMLVAVIAMLLSQAAEAGRRRQSERRIVTLEECGGRRLERDFQDGDYVGKVLGSCDDGSPRRIVGIYVVKEEQGRKKGLLH